MTKISTFSARQFETNTEERSAKIYFWVNLFLEYFMLQMILSIFTYSVQFLCNMMLSLFPVKNLFVYSILTCLQNTEFRI